MNNNKKYIIIFITLMFFCLALLWWIILPTTSNIKQYSKQVMEEKNNLFKLLKQGQSVIENKKNLKQLGTEINNLDKVWLQTGNELSFITDLENIAKKYNLKQTIIFDNTKMTTLTGSTNINKIPIELKISGELNNIMQYINQLEMLDYYISINTIDIHNQKNINKKFPSQINNDEITPEKNIISMDISGITYWKK